MYLNQCQAAINENVVENTTTKNIDLIKANLEIKRNFNGWIETEIKLKVKICIMFYLFEIAFVFMPNRKKICTRTNWFLFAERSNCSSAFFFSLLWADQSADLQHS